MIVPFALGHLSGSFDNGLADFFVEIVLRHIGKRRGAFNNAKAAHQGFGHGLGADGKVDQGAG